jgi:DNA-binding LacI/PurR family transcriptional regulator
MRCKKQDIDLAVSKSEQVRRRLRDSIRNGKFEMGKAIPSDNDLSTFFGISRNTVREAISSLVSEGLLIRIQGKGTFLREDTACGDEVATRPIITLVGWEAQGAIKEIPFFNVIMRGAHAHLATQGWAMTLRMIGSGETFAGNFKSLGDVDALRNGIIFASYVVTKEDTELLAREGIPAVSIGRPGEGVVIDYVDTDHAAGVATAVNHLFGLGHRRVAFIDIASYPPGFQERRSSFLRMHRERGIAVDPDLMIESASDDESIERKMAKILSADPRRFTALMVYGEHATFAAVSLLRQHGLRVPQDVSVLALYPSPWITTALGLELTKLTQSTCELGRLAAELLTVGKLERKRASRAVVIPAEFVVGASCAALRDVPSRPAVRSAGGRAKRSAQALSC